jgi:hypothetical protein
MRTCKYARRSLCGYETVILLLMVTYQFSVRLSIWTSTSMIQAKGINFSIMRFGNFAAKRNRGMIGSLRDRSKYNGSRVWGFRGVKARVGHEAQTDCD